MEYSNRSSKYLKNKVINFLVFGSIYLNMEIITRACCKCLVGFNNITKWSLCGWTSLWMFPIGGLCAVLIGSLNDRPRYYNLKMWQQVIIGGSLISAVELITGVFFNLYLHLNLWDYSENKFNFMGQISLQNCILWYLLSVVVIWFDDLLSYYFYDEEKPQSLLSYFIRLIKFQ